MRELEVDIDLPTFNALTDAFVRNGRLGQAEAVLDQMAAVGMDPSTRTFNTLLKGYSRAGQLGRAFSVVRRGEIARARQIVRWLVEGQARGIADRPPPSVQAFTALLKGCVAPPARAALPTRTPPNASTASTAARLDDRHRRCQGIWQRWEHLNQGGPGGPCGDRLRDPELHGLARGGRRGLQVDDGCAWCGARRYSQHCRCRQGSGTLHGRDLVRLSSQGPQGCQGAAAQVIHASAQGAALALSALCGPLEHVSATRSSEE